MSFKKAEIDYRLYLVTDRLLAGGKSLEQIVRQSAEGGITVIQHREKISGTRDFLRQSLAFKKVASDFGIPFIVNDRIDIALACKADGVHLGQEDMDCALVRRMTGPDMIIGVSVSTPEEAIEAERAGADYLGAGPIYSTPTKPDAVEAIGPATLCRIRDAVRLPIVAIGGINDSNAAEIVRCGADGIAVVSAIIAALDPRGSARRLRNLVDVELRRRGAADSAGR
ncbi:MAG: thiamine phosphate synthase [Desulfobacteraceae bacterium]|nr:thiamine phosphate synthase [Desulfobacteraceae bacterium]